MPVITVVLHDMPQDGLMAHGHHRLWDILGILSNPSSKTAAEQNNFHLANTLTRRRCRIALFKAFELILENFSGRG
jgi:hypothetical protein